jgi:hypothetical protein
MTIQVDLEPEMEAWLVAGEQGRNQAFSLSGVVLKFGKLPLGNSHLLSSKSKYFVRDISCTSSRSHKHKDHRARFFARTFSAPIHGED